jgi:hypothetical protein
MYRSGSSRAWCRRGATRILSGEVIYFGSSSSAVSPGLLPIISDPTQCLSSGVTLGHVDKAQVLEQRGPALTVTLC